ncbi:TPA: hypothetical protein ACUNCG_000426 [Aeromonas hydrophila]
MEQKEIISHCEQCNSISQQKFEKMLKEHREALVALSKSKKE